MKLKNIGKLILGLALCLTVVGCQNNESNNKESNKAAASKAESNKNSNEAKKTGNLTIFAAASMTDVLDELKSEFQKENPGSELTFNFDSSGTLKTQIDSGAKADVFISAAQKQMNGLEEENKLENDTRIDLLENEVTLAIAKGSDKKITDFKDLSSDKVDKIALGNSDVPVGQYSEEILKKLGIWDEIQDKITFGSNVREVTTWVSEKTVDCGIVYKTDAIIADLDVVAVADDSMLENKVIYPAAVLKDSQNKELAKKYIKFLQSEKASEIFKKYGFKPLGK
ncbi:molybdate ABC transporter substrate-binding protein [Anaerococcus sp. AGMB00486]|uniref:Molybdate ABC transporter substrate-binding protein n=2 Tax=Anaerococcus TaxID=165779 RepID=A0ABX2NCB6_9FIRM|nr:MULTISPECIES: molybdate ABC transporter substrate-binding protein [Anaerococcus]MSS77914.1 molybdate ABC transporter substrate-binding protein [Anaerococcus porci]NVF12333.1 molybdate ABC transporter substrate-binding protein [Anaerococcus faecalis]